MIDSFAQFRDAIRATGLKPPDIIEPGKIYRFPGVGKGQSNQAGWCLLLDDGLGGSFGDWSSGLSENWHAKQYKSFLVSEKIAFQHRVKDARKQAEDKRQEKFMSATKKVITIWDMAKPANDEHPYLSRKAIKANGSRLHKGTLVIPVRSGSELISLQFIDENGNKGFDQY